LQVKHYKRRGRGIFDDAMKYGKQGLSMSKQFGVADALKGQSDKNLKLAGQLLSMAGGGRRRKRGMY
jgi:hypothetical protein